MTLANDSNRSDPSLARSFVVCMRCAGVSRLDEHLVRVKVDVASIEGRENRERLESACELMKRFIASKPS
jgi:hypothetical protein